MPGSGGEIDAGGSGCRSVMVVVAVDGWRWCGRCWWWLLT